jgi:hypothetical protein
MDKSQWRKIVNLHDEMHRQNNHPTATQDNGMLISNFIFRLTGFLRNGSSPAVHGCGSI